MRTARPRSGAQSQEMPVNRAGARCVSPVLVAEVNSLLRPDHLHAEAGYRLIKHIRFCPQNPSRSRSQIPPTKNAITVAALINKVIPRHQVISFRESRMFASGNPVALTMMRRENAQYGADHRIPRIAPCISIKKEIPAMSASTYNAATTAIIRNRLFEISIFCGLSDSWFTLLIGHTEKTTGFSPRTSTLNVSPKPRTGAAGAWIRLFIMRC